MLGHPIQMGAMQSVTESWQAAQRLEAAAAWQQAQPLYASILAQEPDHVPARLRMSRLEQFADRYGPARAHALHAAEAVRRGIGVRNIGYVSGRLLDFAEEGEVASLILSADWRDPEVIRHSPTLAQHLWLSGRYADALRLLDAIEPLTTPHPLLHFTRANVLRYLGDMPAAERHYEACLALSPGMADAHWALATHSRANPPLSRLPRLQRALQDASDDAARAHLLYARFREHDDAGDTAAAWDALSSGAALMHRRDAFCARLEAEMLETLMDAPVAPPGSGDATGPRPVFVVGMPRTGTTLLDRVLGNHPQVHSLGERNDLAAAISEASGHFFHPALRSGVPELMEMAARADVGERYLRRVRRDAPSVSHLVDKNPLNLFCIPAILRALPRARVLVLRREPMDACFSNLKELFQGGAYAYSYALEDLAGHCRNVRRWTAHWARVAPESVRVVDYEALVRDPASVAASLLPFLDLPAHASLHDIAGNTAPVSTASSSQVREGVHQRAVGAWRRYEAQLQPLREMLGEHA
ncbi:tetratricopeptide repeat-containing sulfotransferase family protein [Pseudoxanthomonas daejeonensis]|nr:sulfotransferase [Pseudoxanthomonas daejeonensis]